MNTTDLLKNLAQRIRHGIVESTTVAGSGHPSSSLSAVELITVLFFGGFLKQDISNFQNAYNDKFILSKGHAAPLLYSLYEAAGTISREELLTLRAFSSRLQGHPTPEVPFVDVTTGSLGQGLSVGVGMALGFQLKAKSSKLKAPNVFVLLGDSEFAEGQNYEALQMASHYKLGNLIAILDVNRLGQRGETQLGWDVQTYKNRVESFGWNAVIIQDGHDVEEIQKGYTSILSPQPSEKPTMLIAKTVKGKGVSFMENADNWHGKAIPKDKLESVLKEIGEIDFTTKGVIAKPDSVSAHFPASALPQNGNPRVSGIPLDLSHLVSPLSTRQAYGIALADLAKQNPFLIALDAETSNSTYAEFVKKETPGQFIECYIAEQNMVGMALGLSKVGYTPFASSFAAFLTRAYDQIRMSQYSNTHLAIVGSHAGCSIGVDGASQMALEDISMMRSVNNSTVVYPSDGISAYKLTYLIASNPGINYIRTTREATPLLYGLSEEFPIGGCKVHYPKKDQFEYMIVTAGITLHEALKAQKILEEKNTNAVVVDLYSIKPIDSRTLQNLATKVKRIVVVEDHYEAGGIGEAVLSALRFRPPTRLTHLCVHKEPRSGTLEELLRYEEIDSEAICKACVNSDP